MNFSGLSIIFQLVHNFVTAMTLYSLPWLLIIRLFLLVSSGTWSVTRCNMRCKDWKKKWDKCNVTQWNQDFWCNVSCRQKCNSLQIQSEFENSKWIRVNSMQFLENSLQFLENSLQIRETEKSGILSNIQIRSLQIRKNSTQFIENSW